MKYAELGGTKCRKGKERKRMMECLLRVPKTLPIELRDKH